MKKVFSGLNWKSFRNVFLSLLVLSSLLFLCRWIDQSWIQYDLPYGYFHYPAKQTIPFFRKGVPEPGYINQYGIREVSLKENAKCNYLLLGDSQTFGSGIFAEDRFSEILNRETECQWTNVSMPGFTLENEYAFFQKLKDEVTFERAYLVIYGNDIYETGDTPDYLHYVDKQKWYRHLLGFFLPELTRYHLKKEYFDSVQVRLENELQKFANTQYETKKQKNLNFDEENGNEPFLSFHTLYSISPNYFKESLDVNTYASIHFQRWKKILYRFHSELKEKKKELVLVYIPLDVEFDPIRFQVYQKIGFEMNPNWIKGESEMILELLQLSKELGIGLIDLRPLFRKETNLLQKEDIHFNEKANRLIAERIKKSL